MDNLWDKNTPHVFEILSAPLAPERCLSVCFGLDSVAAGLCSESSLFGFVFVVSRHELRFVRAAVSKGLRACSEHSWPSPRRSSK